MRHQVFAGLEPGSVRRILPLAVVVLLIPAAHPLLRPIVGVPSHLLWFVHVLAIAIAGYAGGLRLGLPFVVASTTLVVVGERFLGGGYGVPADWATVAALASAVGFVDLLVLGFSWWVRDGELRRRAVESVAALALEEAPDAMLLLDEHQTITMANAAAGRLFKTVSVALLHQPFRELVATGEVPSTSRAVDEVVLHLADGSLLSAERRVTVVGSDADSRRLVTLRDVTAQVREEAGRRRTLVLAELGQVLAGVAHELNNPLASVVAFGELLLLDGGVPERERETVSAMREEALRAAGIARRLLRLVRDQDAEREVQPIGPVVRKALSTQMVSLAAHGIRLDEDIPEALPDVAVDAGEIEQILVNLVVNAQHALDQSRPDPRIRVTVAVVPEGLRVIVADNGPGIPGHVVDQIFEPFVTTKGDAGTGLGLAIARRIARAHGGDLMLATDPLGGAAFALTLPAAPGDSAQGAAPPVVRVGGGRRALIVDDEQHLRHSLRRVLEHFGWVVETADSVAAAFGAMCDSWDAIVCDMRLPDGSGSTVYEQALARFPEIKGRFVFITGDAMSADTAGFLETSGERWISKPFEISEIREALDAVSLTGSPVEGPAR